MKSSREHFLKAALEQRESDNSKRELRSSKSLVDFCSNDYLGFAKDGKSKIEVRSYNDSGYQCLDGSTGSRLLTGNSAEIEAVERKIAGFHNGDSALIFNSGYDANLGFFSCVPARTDVVLYDELIHASIRDGMRLGVARTRSFAHNDVRDLQAQLERIDRQYGSGTRVFVAVESVYSMDGDSAPLLEIIEALDVDRHLLVVDEAHALGVFGDSGVGLVGELGVESNVFARLYTFGKALGCHGAAWVGSSLLRDYLINFSRPFIYTTALPFHAVESIETGYDMLSGDDFKIHEFREIIDLFKQKVSGVDVQGWMPSESAIHCFQISGNDRVRSIAEKLQNDGFDVRPILHPTVPVGRERLRVCLHVFNTPEQMDQLLVRLKNLTE